VRAPSLAVPRDRASVVRALAVAVFLAVALSSAVRTWPDTWNDFGRERATLAAQGASPALASAARGVAVDPAVLDFYAARLRPGDRYVFQVPSSFSATSQLILRQISALALLPAIGVEDRANADVLLSYSADPRALQLAYPSEQYADEQHGVLPYFVTRLHA
jgi:hypothetical protein